MLTGEQGGFQAEKGVRRSFCKQVVYLHPVKHEQHLLSFGWEVRDVLQPLETVHKPVFFFFEFVFVTPPTPPVYFSLHSSERSGCQDFTEVLGFSETVT